MTRRPAPVPTHLGDAFTSADALAAGLTPAQVRRLPSPFHGVRCRTPPTTVEEQARAATLALPVGAALAGRTAAHLHGLWLPAPVTVETPVDAVVPPGRDLPRTAGIACRRDECEVVDVAGLPVVSPADVFVQLSPPLGLVDRVTLGDSVVRWGSGREVGVLADAMMPGRRGVARRGGRCRWCGPGRRRRRRPTRGCGSSTRGCPSPS